MCVVYRCVRRGKLLHPLSLPNTHTRDDDDVDEGEEEEGDRGRGDKQWDKDAARWRKIEGISLQKEPHQASDSIKTQHNF